MLDSASVKVLRNKTPVKINHMMGEQTMEFEKLKS